MNVLKSTNIYFGENMVNLLNRSSLILLIHTAWWTVCFLVLPIYGWKYHKLKATVCFPQIPCKLPLSKILYKQFLNSLFLVCRWNVNLSQFILYKRRFSVLQTYSAVTSAFFNANVTKNAGLNINVQQMYFHFC